MFSPNSLAAAKIGTVLQHLETLHSYETIIFTVYSQIPTTNARATPHDAELQRLLSDGNCSLPLSYATLIYTIVELKDKLLSGSYVELLNVNVVLSVTWHRYLRLLDLTWKTIQCHRGAPYLSDPTMFDSPATFYDAVKACLNVKRELVVATLGLIDEKYVAEYLCDSATSLDPIPPVSL